MLDIIDELSDPVDLVEHIHSHQIVITIVSSGKRLHLYHDDNKIGWYKIAQSFWQLALQFIHIEKDWKFLQKVMPYFEQACISNVVFVGNFTVGLLCNSTLAFFLDDFKNRLLNNDFNEGLNILITRKIDLSLILNKQAQIVYIALISLCNGPNLFVISQDLYLSLFGLEAFKCKYQVLLLFLCNGHIWYIFLKDSAIPIFLYSIDGKCRKLFTNVLSSTLTVYTDRRRSYRFVADADTYNVTKFCDYSNQEFVENYCDHMVLPGESCQPNLHVRDKTVLYRRDLQSVELSHEECINNLRTALRDVEIDKDTYNDLVKKRFLALQNLESLAILSSSEEKLVDFKLTEGSLELHRSSTLVDHRMLCVILTSDFASTTMYCKEDLITIPVETALKYQNVLCLFYENELWVKCGFLHYDTLNFATLVKQPPKLDLSAFKIEFSFNSSVNKFLTSLLTKLFKLEEVFSDYEFCLKVVETVILFHIRSKTSLHILCAQCNSNYILKSVVNALFCRISHECNVNDIINSLSKT